MSALWIALAFVAGWVACWKFSSWLLRRVLRRPTKMMEDAIRGLNQDALVKITQTANSEIEKRKRGLAA